MAARYRPRGSSGTPQPPEYPAFQASAPITIPAATPATAPPGPPTIVPTRTALATPIGMPNAPPSTRIRDWTGWSMGMRSRPTELSLPSRIRFRKRESTDVGTARLRYPAPAVETTRSHPCQVTGAPRTSAQTVTITSVTTPNVR